MDNRRKCPHCGGIVIQYLGESTNAGKFWIDINDMERSYRSFILCPAERLLFHGVVGADKAEVEQATFDAWQAGELDDQGERAPEGFTKRLLDKIEQEFGQWIS